MAEYPALPIWTDSYLADTRHLTLAEHGAYLLLLMEAWRRPDCSLPDNDALLARLTVSTPEEWAAMKPIIMGLWILDGRTKKWRQKRLTQEREYLIEKRKSQKVRAVNGWETRKKGDAPAMPGESPADAPTPTPIEKKNAKKKSDEVDQVEARFAPLWEAFPRRDARSNRVKAVSAFATLSEPDQELCVKAGLAYAADWNGKLFKGNEPIEEKKRFLPYLANYIANEDWRT